MRERSKKILFKEETALCGLFSKKEAALRISEGVRHLHSSTLAQKDPLAKLTEAALRKDEFPTYPWEIKSEAKKTILASSSTRHQVIQKIIGDLGIETKRDLTEKISAVLEELISNSFYHAYRDKSGLSKYPRKSPANLEKQEQLSITYASQNTGIYLCVQDQGGRFPFEAVADAFSRCYGPNKEQISTKDDGAGLGLYMIYEYSTHIKIELNTGKLTKTSCWVADKKNYDPDYFSFNFFERGSNDSK